MNISLSKLKLITFDVTNTLLKFKVPAWQYYAMIAQDHGFKGSPEDVKPKFIKTFKQMWEEHPNFGKKSIKWEDWWCQVVTTTLRDNLPSDAKLDVIAHKLIEEFKTDRCWTCVDGEHKLIDHFRTLGISVGVISNFDPRLHDILHNVGLYKKFDFIVTSYEAGYSKPDERIFKSAIDKCIMSVSPSEALHIGDDVIKDYEGARMAGWHALLVNPKISQPAKVPQNHIFKSLEELSAAVQQNTLTL
ncbi:hypothetical protein PYW07_000015 [Mythimna separata]|uniref:Uncharacterized protein n=1 Tax=Mythimna separata TaxID=271217 RepID=A0AAD7Z2J5_MYTSE|nr:hypothetical protein PYW07_000015 [Mythimna separata]